MNIFVFIDLHAQYIQGGSYRFSHYKKSLFCLKDIPYLNKNIHQEKFVVYFYAYFIETSSLWAEFVNKNRCISVRLVSEEVKALNFDHFVNSQQFPMTKIFH